jgi:hypothetical protein
VPVQEDGYVVFAESRNILWSPFPEGTGNWPAET